MGKLDGKVAVVTGASKGIGASIAEELALEGASVVVNYASSKQGAEVVVSKITAAGGKAIAVGADVSKPEDIAKLIGEAVKAFGKIDVLVNNAGVYGMTPLETITPEEFHRMFNLNVLGLLLTIQAAVPHFPASGGSIINVGSGVGRNGMAGMSIYSATKGAVDTISVSLGKELGAKGIRVNSLNPGPVTTEGAADFAPFFEQMKSQIPLGRIGVPKDIGTAAVFLASDDSSWITSDAIFVAGGFR